MSTSTWPPDADELSRGDVYSAAFHFDPRYNEWWPLDRVPGPPRHLARIDLGNLASYQPYLDITRSVEISFQVLSVETGESESGTETVYRCRIIRVEGVDE